MSDNKKYYYLKLKDNFFDNEKMIILESMADGYIYSNILLKLYLRSLKGEGRLMFNDRIPYNPTLLAQITRHSIGDVTRAIEIFKEFDLVEAMDNGAIYMMDIQNFIGHSSSEADRQRDYQKRLKESEGSDPKLLECKKSNKKSNMKPTPEKEIEIDIDIDLDEEQKPPSKNTIYRVVQHLTISEIDYNKLCERFGCKVVDNKLDYCDNYAGLKKYVSLYKLLCNWLEKDLKEKTPAQTAYTGFNDYYDNGED